MMCNHSNKANCGCCEGTQLTPTTPANRPGLAALAYRVGIHATFLETMKARLSMLGKFEGSKLFELNERIDEFRSQLDANLLSELLRMQFQEHAVTLSETAGVHVEKTGSKWTIHDIGADYLIRSGVETLAVYAESRPLQMLTTRATDDAGIALLDAWATVADVLTFYQERIANEGYLPTATERRSVVELANLIGYELRPGVAASTFLAFTLENGHEVEIPAGTRAQSLPGPGELPQPFETAEPLLARSEWNAMRPRLMEPQLLSENTTTAYTADIQSNLNQDDPVLIVAAEGGKAVPYFRRVHAIELDAPAETTTIMLTGDLVLSKLLSLLENRPAVELKQVSPPELLAPAFHDDGTVELRWLKSTPASGETVYSVYLHLQTADETEEDAGVEHNEIATNISDTHLVLTQFEPGQTYDWYVVVKDEISKANSAESSFSIPMLGENATVPAADVHNVPLSPVLHWPGSADAHYTVVYATSEETLPAIVLNSNNTERELPRLLHATTYYWRIIGINRSDDGVELMAARSFTTAAEPTADEDVTASAVDVVTDSGDDNLQNVSTTPTLRWTAASSDIKRYVLLYGMERDAVANTVVNNLGTELSLSNLQPETTYTWRVVDTRNIERVALRKFRTSEESGMFQSPQPADYMIATPFVRGNRTIEVSWLSNLNDNFTFTVHYGIDKDALEFSVSTDRSTATLVEIDPGKRYYWQVTAQQGEEQIRGPLWHFTASGLTAEDQLRQAAAQSVFDNIYRRFVNDETTKQFVRAGSPVRNVSPRPVIDWPGGALMTYEVLLDTVDPPRQVVARITDGSHYQPDKPLESFTVYYWEVRLPGRTTPSFSGEFTTANLPLLDRLQNPDLSAAILRSYVDIEKPALARDETIFSKYIQSNLFSYPETSLDFSLFVQSLQALQLELNNLTSQLDLRRLDLGGQERVFTDKFIDENAIAEIAGHLNKKPAVTAGIDQGKILRPALDLLATDASQLTVTLVSTTGTDDDKIAAVLKDVHRLDDTYQLFVELDAPEDIRGWVNAMRVLLEQDVITQMAPLESRATRGLANLVETLTQASQSQLTSRLRLERDISDVLGTNADLTTRLLTTFRPELQGTFYEAWAQSDFTPVSPLQSVEALRARAAPLGARNALAPIYDEARNIIGHREWPLMALSVTLSFDSYFLSNSVTTNPSHYHWPVHIQMTLTRDAEAMQEERKIDPDDKLLDFLLHGLAIRVRLTPSRQHGFERINIEIMGENVLELRMRNQSDGDRSQVLIIGTYERTLQANGAFTITDNINGQPVTIHQDFGSSVTPKFSIDLLPIPIPNALLNVLTLDAEYNKVTSGSWLVMERTGEASAAATQPGLTTNTIYRVLQATTVSKPNYGKVTQLTLDKPWLQKTDRSLALVRNIVIYLQSESLPLAQQIRQEIVRGSTLTLNGLYEGLTAGRWLIVSGERTDIAGTKGIRTSELVLIGGVKHVIQQDANGNDIPGDTPHTQITLTGDGLLHTYKRDTVTIYGNVVKATHGETHEEVLGSGDGRKTHQSFALKQSPLTHIAAPTVDGIASTLEVRVNTIRWHETDNLIWLTANDRGYVTDTDDTGKTTVIFGDGTHGARLPTGIENIKATYRSGIGKVGNVDANRISLLMGKPLGVKEVINPLRASGGADRERRDQARQNAPLALMALDRLVSLQDYADFARTYAGIGKAGATSLVTDHETIYITIAGADDIPIAATSELYQGLREALHSFGTLNHPIQIALRELLLIFISARVRLQPDYLWETVEHAIRASLLDKFSFDQRDLGQIVLLSEIINTIQGVAGVAYVDVDILDAIHENTPPQELETLAAALTTDKAQPFSHIQLQPARVQTHHVVQRTNETYLSIAARYRDISPVELQSWNNAQTPLDAPLAKGTSLTLNSRRMRPAQLAYLSPDLPDLLILKEVTA